jgi:peptidyl-prolyl cis-trans isomerase D
MAVIGKIRQRSGLLIFLIGLSIVGFLVMDATNSQGSLLKGRKDSVGVVNGEKISYNDFTKKYEENVKNAEEQMRGQPMGDDQRNYMRTQTWNEMVNDIIFNKTYTSLGIGVTADEMRELAMGENASPYIRQDQQFKNPQTGQFDPAQVGLYLQRLDQDPQGVEPGTVRRQWLKFETLLKKNQYQQKYDNLVSKAFYIPAWMGEMAYYDQSRTVDFKYVQLPYTDIDDTEVKVSDDDLKKYLKEHEARFTQTDETRKIQYVVFDITASASDHIVLREALEEKREEFAKGENPSDDSLFVKLYSETPFDEVYYDKDKITASVKDSFFNLSVKSIVGPYQDGNFYKLAKISNRKMISDSVHVRDIKISFEGISTQEAANVKFKLIDSIFKLVDTLKVDFGTVAATYSDDMVGKMRGGDIGWVKQGEKDKMYNDLIFYRAQKGKLYRVPSQTENAIHIIQVVEDRPSKPAVQIAYFSKEIIPSGETERAIYSTATAFASDNQSAAKFKEAAKKLNVKNVTVQKDAFSVEGIGSARELVKWAFAAKKGDVSPVFTVAKKHAVVLLEEISPAGVPPLDAVRETIKPLAIREKKFELLAKKVEDSKGASVDDIAGKLGKTAAQADKASFGNPSLSGGYEPAVVATALAVAPNKVSKPIKGNAGVYVVQTIAVQEPAKMNDYSMFTMQAKQQLQGKVRSAPEVQKKLAKIEDDRFEFF